MKSFLFIGFMLLTLPLWAQLDNTAFDQPIHLDPTDSGQFFLGFNTVGFAKNNEYFNDIADGYTLFGYQVNPYVLYQPLPSVSLSVGVYLQKDFGVDDYETILPTYSFKYKKNNTALIFGTLEGSTMHRLIEPLYDFERVLNDRLENGIQVKIEKDKLFLDGWVDWLNMIYKGDEEQEEIRGGLSLVYRLINKEKLTLGIPLQLVVYHQGGQIDNNPNPLTTIINGSIGSQLQVKTGGSGWVRSVDFEPYFVWYSDMSSNTRNAFEDGEGIYLNVNVKTKFSMDVMASYWKGTEFVSVGGGQLYPSVSSTFKEPDYIEPDRELLIVRFLHTLKLADDLSLSTRVEPLYDLNNNTFEFSHGFYINYTTDFRIGKRNK